MKSVTSVLLITMSRKDINSVSQKKRSIGREITNELWQYSKWKHLKDCEVFSRCLREPADTCLSCAISKGTLCPQPNPASLRSSSGRTFSNVFKHLYFGSYTVCICALSLMTRAVDGISNGSSSSARERMRRTLNWKF